MSEEGCRTCKGTGLCINCQDGAPEVCSMCVCMASGKCVDCYGAGTYGAYATEQMRRLRLYLSKQGIIP